MRRKLTILAVAAIVAVLAAPAAAFAHDCYNASRSAKGNQGAENSQVWFRLTAEMIVNDCVWDPAEDDCLLDDDQQPIPLIADEDERDAALQEILDAGFPEDGILIHTRSLLARGIYGSPLGSNGKGIDHFWSTWGQVFVDAICQYEPAASQEETCAGGPGE